MVQRLEGNFDGKGLRVQIVASRFNELITSKLLEGALDGLIRHGVDEKDITVVWAPGSFEIPITVHHLASVANPADVIICLGAVIRGSTDHYHFVANEMAKGIAQVSLQTGVPVIFGVLTTDTIEQAVERAGTKMGNKGFDSASAAIEMANLVRKIGRD